MLGDLQADAAEEGVKEEEGGCQAPGLEDVGKVESKVQDKASTCHSTTAGDATMQEN